MKIRQTTFNRIAASLALPLALTTVSRADAQGLSKPNVIVIMADDLGYETMRAYGGSQYDTPNINDLATQGMRFDHGYAQPLCTPTRTKIMTGMSNLRNYERFNIVNPDSITFGHVMQDAGYKTTIAGKWQLFGAKHRVGEGPGTGLHPDDAGFDSYMLWQVEQMSQGNGSVPSPDDRYWGPYLHVNNAYVDTTIINGAYNNDGTPISGGIGTGTVLVGNASIDYQNEQYASDLLVEHINQFVTESVVSGDPFFVYYPMLLTHDPFQQTPDSPGLTNANRYSASNNFFGDMVEYMDVCIGKIVSHLELEGVRDDTIVIFLGDNGTKWTITSTMLNGTSVTGAKRHLIDEGTRVPFIVSWPDGQTSSVQGSATDELVDVGDIMATIVEAAGSQLPAFNAKNGDVMRYDGTSFLAQIRGEASEDCDWLYTYCDRHGNGISNSTVAGGKIQDGEYARNQQYKLYGDENGQGFHANQFYDMVADPKELSPLDLNNLSVEESLEYELLQAAIDMMRSRLDPVAGDANGDFRVNEIDLAIYNSGSLLADFNGDGVVDEKDLAILNANFGLDAVKLAGVGSCAGICYADCDQTTGVGVLDIFDFLCFQNSFVNAEPYACDCDTSTGPGVCDIFDFLCFQNAFVSGCP